MRKIVFHDEVDDCLQHEALQSYALSILSLGAEQLPAAAHSHQSVAAAVRYRAEKREELMREAFKYDDLVDLLSKMSVDYRALKQKMCKPKVTPNIDTGLQRSVDRSLCLNNDGLTDPAQSPVRSARQIQSSSLEIGAPDISSLVVEEENRESPGQSSRIEDSNDEMRNFLEKETNIRVLDSPKLDSPPREVRPTRQQPPSLVDA